MQNSIKHAHCKKIQVDLNRTEKDLRLSLQDDGKGFETTVVNGKRIGLSNIKKRAELISGSYQLESKPNNGTRLNIKIPL